VYDDANVRPFVVRMHDQISERGPDIDDG